MHNLFIFIPPQLQWRRVSCTDQTLAYDPVFVPGGNFVCMQRSITLMDPARSLLVVTGSRERARWPLGRKSIFTVTQPSTQWMVQMQLLLEDINTFKDVQTFSVLFSWVSSSYYRDVGLTANSELPEVSERFLFGSAPGWTAGTGSRNQTTAVPIVKMLNSVWLMQS